MGFIVNSHLLEVQQLLLAASAVVPELAAAVAVAVAAVAAEAEAGSLEAAAGSRLLSAPLLQHKECYCRQALSIHVVCKIKKPDAPDCTTWACCWGWG